jgi:PAS domain S-box-containing protein
MMAKVRTQMDLHSMQQKLEEILTRRTDQAIESEQRFRATIEQAAVGIAHISPEGRFLRINKKFCEIVGYSEDELLALTFQDITHPDDLNADLELARQVLNGQRETYSMDKRYYRKDGSIVWISLTVSLVFDRGGGPKYFVSVIQDISDRKQAEEALQQGHAFLKHLTSSVPDAIFSVKIPERTIEWADDSFNVMGYEPDECIGKSTRDFYANADDYDKVGNLQQDAIRKGEDMIRTEVMVTRKDGRVIPVELTASYYKTNGKLERVTAIVRDISERRLAHDKLHKAYIEIKDLKEQLQAENIYLQEEIKSEHDFENIIGQSEALRYVLHRVAQVAPLDSAVLILGESGTGKELIARSIHQRSSRSKRPMVKVNCAALPRELIESELFGHEKGAYTGAAEARTGRFELANGSTLFLDEIGDFPLELQAKLLRVLESGEFERLGSSRTMHSDARIIAATNRDLLEEVRQNRFRADLYYRLKIFPITVPPLRNRTEDIPLLVNSFVHMLAGKIGKKGTYKVPETVMQTLQSYSWRGNVRELMHAVEGALISAQGNELEFDLPDNEEAAMSGFKTLEDVERQYILGVLKAKNWKIGGEDSTASMLGIPSSTLRSRMKKLGLKRP